jgi:hydroxyethylthiazole kinase-like uncharacterized protein yjeF
MDPVLRASEMGEIDRWAIEQAGVPSLDLMESAGRGLAEVVAEAASTRSVAVVCGKGNNAGDGLVAARHLAGMGIPVEVLMLWDPAELSPDSRANFERLGKVPSFSGPDALDRLGSAGVVVDAVLGTGFAGEPRSPVSEAITAIQAAASRGAEVIACDVPSGVDGSTGAGSFAVAASRTVTFHARKVGHVIAPGKHLSGEVTVVPIGIPPGSPVEPVAGTITPRIRDLLPRRTAGSTKFSSGRVTVVGGSVGLTGAVCLAAEGAARAGAGYVTVAVPEATWEIFETKLTEVMTFPAGDGNGTFGPAERDQLLGHLAGTGTAVLGSGIGRDDGTAELVRDLAQAIDKPLVIDADGLDALAGAPGLVASRESPTILTPHPGEMARLLGVSSAEVSTARLDSALELARLTGAVAVLKGDDTVITDGSRIAVNDLPAPALATAGTGDVLAGVCGAFLAGGLEPFEAACAAVFCHARAGELAALEVGSAEGVIAGDVIGALPAAIA